jgi:hypothetical protein
MNRNLNRWILCSTLLLLVAGPVWAADQTSSTNDLPAILSSLDAGNAEILDDQTAAIVRGGADFSYLYVLVKIFGVNTFDWGPGVQWTWNPLGFRYGAYGGPGWSNFSEDPADDMDALFMMHDTAYASSGADLLEADKTLFYGLLGLATTGDSYWGMIYDPADPPLGLTSPIVKVSGLSLIGSRFSFRWHVMPYTEYARREALAGMGLMVFGRSLASIALQ